MPAHHVRSRGVRLMVHLLPALLLGVAWIGGARAQAAAGPDNAELARQLARSLRLIDALAARVGQLESQLAELRGPTKSPDVAASNANANARLDDVEKAVSQLAVDAGRPARDAGGLALHGFADTVMVGTRHAQPGQQSGFAVGSLDLYLTPELGDHVKTLVEMNVGIEEHGGSSIDIERLQIGYTLNDALTVWLGRFHTPIGYWNMAFHHGAEIQTSVLRPRMLDFEDDGGFLPVHSVGLWATGAQRLGSDRLLYHLFVGNGASIRDGLLNPNPGGDTDGNKAAGFGLSYRFGGRFDGWTAGLGGLTQKVAAYDSADRPTSTTRLRLLGSYAAYDNDGWELIGEAYAFRNDNISGGTGRHGSWAAFAQVGRTIGDRWVPYYRFEKASLSPDDDYFAALGSGRFAQRHVVGLRVNLASRAALKLELDRTRQRDSVGDLDEMRIQYAIGF